MKFFYTLLLLSFLNNSFATTITLRPGPSTGKDALIRSGAPTSNSGNSVEFPNYTWTCNGILCLGRNLIQFDLSAIQPGDILVSASLSLYAENNTPYYGPSGTPTYGTDNAGWLKRITSSWQENTVTWNNQPGTTDVNKVALPQSTSTSQNYLDVDVTQLVQDMLTHGNNGFMVMMQNETTFYNKLVFASGDHPDSTLRPKLVLSYNSPTGLSSNLSKSKNLKIFPNPAANEVTIEFEEMEFQNSYIELYDLAGKKVSRIVPSGSKTLYNVSEFQRGLYFYKIFKDSSPVQTGKIVLQ